MQTFRDFNKIKKGVDSCPGSFVTMKGPTEVNIEFKGGANDGSRNSFTRHRVVSTCGL